MTLSSKQIGDIANLYESITSSKQEQLDEIAVNFGGNAALQAKRKEMAQQSQSQSRLDAMRAQRFGGVNPVVKAAKGGVQGTLDKTTGKFTPSAARPAAPAPSAAPARPAAAPAARPAATPAKVVPSKPAGSAMDQWAKANPKLAAAAAEKARIRGTQQTDNPLMKDMRSSLPMKSPSVQAPAVAKLGAGNQSLTQNPNAFKAATISAAPSTSAAASGSVAPATAKIASATTQPPVAPVKKTLTQSYEHDAYDLVLEYLLDNGHVDTVDEAHYVMLEMDSEMIQSIVEGEDGKKEPQKPFTGEGPRKPKGWKPTGPTLKYGQRPGYAR